MVAAASALLFTEELKSDIMVTLFYVTPYFLSALSVSQNLLKSAAQLHHTWSGAGFPVDGGKRQVVSSHDQGHKNIKTTPRGSCSFAV